MHACGGKQKREKKCHKWVRRTILVIHDHGEKTQEVGRDGLGDQRGSWGGMEGKQEACGVI